MSPTRRTLGRFTLAALLTTLVAWAPAQERGSERPPDGLFYPRTIVLVRHAEKAADDPRDPTLSEAGQERAQRLADLFAASDVTHLYATEYKRTQQTLLPLARAAGHEVSIVPARDARALLSALDSVPRNAVAVVAGHSNTIPALVTELAKGSRTVQQAPESLKLDESTYERLFVVTQWGPGKASTLLELAY